MIMSNTLFFIKLLNRALEGPDPKDALRQALAEIEKLGAEAAYRKGYEQFRQFMSLVRAGKDKQEALVDPEIWRKAVDEWVESAALGALIPPIILERDEEVLDRFRITGKGPVGTVSGLKPGPYLVRLKTGWILWEGQLSDADLIWRHAFPEEPLPLAAETDQAEIRISREIELLDGELVIRVTPGRTSGRMELLYKG